MLTIHVHKGAGSGETAIVLDTSADNQYDANLEAYLIHKVLENILPAATYFALAEKFENEDFEADDDDDAPDETDIEQAITKFCNYIKDNFRDTKND